MRSDERVLQAAVGDAALDQIEHLADRDQGSFSFYKVRLPMPRHRGLPNNWFFAVLQRTEGRTANKEFETYRSDAESLVRRHLKEDREKALFLVSDEPDFTLPDYLRFDKTNVFFVDAHELPSVRDFPNNPRNAPFLRAIRSKLDSKEIGSRFFDPYKPDDPVSGWQFFGRRNELDRILNSEESFLVVGARKIGKTSLLNEVEQRLKERGEEVLKPAIQHLGDKEGIVGAILHELSPKDSARAVRRQRVLGEDLLHSVLKRLTSTGRITLILDEIGNVIERSGSNDWKVVGLLRQFSQSGRLRLVMSAYQEFFVKQIDDFTGPFVNFSGLIRLRGFSDPEIDELLIDPFALWGQVRDKKALLRQVTSLVGRHPYFLQVLGKHVFSRLLKGGHQNPSTIIKSMFRRGLLDFFRDPLTVLYLQIPSAAERYLYLKRCLEAHADAAPLHDTEITQEWASETLSKLGYRSTEMGRQSLLTDLELRGLTVPIGAVGSRQQIAAPVVFHCMTASEPDLDGYLQRLAQDIELEQDLLMATPAVRPDKGASP